jgi:hypothetical protein
VEKIRQAIRLDFGVSIDSQTAQKLKDMYSDLDAFSPSIRPALKREVASLSSAAKGGASLDFRGMGASNAHELYYGLHADQFAIKGAKDLDQMDLGKVLSAARESERQVTKEFQKRMRERKTIISNYLGEKRKNDLQMVCSGDDCVVIPTRPLLEKEKAELTQRLSRTEKPAAIRVAYVSPNIADSATRNVLAAHGESVEKYLRSELRGKLDPSVLDKIVLAVDVDSVQQGVGKMKLLVGNSRQELKEFQRAQLNFSFSEAVRKFNLSGSGSGRFNYSSN